MLSRHVRIAAVICLAAFSGPALAANTVKVASAKVNGIAVDKYTWLDSKGLQRTVSLKREGGGNPGHGGYAVQMTYQTREGGKTKTITADAAPGGDGGFGYFVSHERYRTFTDNKEGTIAGKVFGKDDSPLGLNFPVVGKSKIGPKSKSASHTFTLDYPRYGTVTPIPRDGNGDEVAKTPTQKSKLKLYELAVTMTWNFEAGTDFPRIDTTVDMSDVGAADRVNFDIRAPYGVLTFDDGKDGVVDQVMWGDRYHFKALSEPVTRASHWVWQVPNKGSRYHALIAGDFEMGLVEPKSYKASATVDNYSDGRGKTWADYHNGNGCPDLAGQILPCDWEWPYQSLQYSLPYDNVNQPTDGKKIAWGTAPYYGAGDTLPEVYDSPTTSRPFDGFPDSKKIRYSTCVVLGKTIQDGLSNAVARGESDLTCATSKP